MIFSDCFEKLCTRKMTKRLHGIFFGVVSRRIGDVEIIMAGEVDCSSSRYLHQLADDNLLTPIPSRHGHGARCKGLHRTENDQEGQLYLTQPFRSLVSQVVPAVVLVRHQDDGHRVP